MSKTSDKPAAPKPAFTNKAQLLAAPYTHTNGASVHYHDGEHAFNAQCRYVGKANLQLAEAAAKAIAPPAPAAAAPVAQPEATSTAPKAESSTDKGK